MRMYPGISRQERMELQHFSKLFDSNTIFFFYLPCGTKVPWKMFFWNIDTEHLLFIFDSWFSGASPPKQVWETLSYVTQKKLDY